MKKFKVSFYILGIIIKNLSVLLLCICMISACSVTSIRSEEDNDTKVFFSNNKDKGDSKTKKKSKKVQSKKVKIKSNDTGGIEKHNKEEISVYPNLSDYAAADINPDEYLFLDSDIKLIKDEVLDNANLWQLRRGINEIYARRGRKFVNEGQRVYFESKNWYRANIEAEDFEEDFLNEYEKNNVALLQERLVSLVQGIDIASLESRAYSFLMEDGVNAVLKSRFDQDTLGNISVKDIIYQLNDVSLDYDNIRKEARNKKIYNGKKGFIGVKSEKLNSLLNKILGFGLNEIYWNESGINYSESEGAYYVIYEDSDRVELVSVELIQADGENYRFMCRKEGYEEDGSFLIVELQSVGNDFKFISVK